MRAPERLFVWEDATELHTVWTETPPAYVCGHEAQEAEILHHYYIRLDVANEVREALEGLADIIDAAGLTNLSNGVQLGALSWHVKASERLGFAREVLAKAKDAS